MTRIVLQGMLPILFQQMDWRKVLQEALIDQRSCLITIVHSHQMSQGT